LSYSIETSNLTKVFQQVKGYRELMLHPFTKKEIFALRDVTFNVKQGELFSLLGPTGAGKTTLIKILCNLVLPSSGKALVNGFDVTKAGKQIRKTIGYVLSDERSFYWRLTGRQNLKFFAALNNLFSQQADKVIEQTLKITGMTDQADNMFKNYSSGQRQKMAIARGLLTNPQVLFMDEPTKSLDPGAAQNLRKFIKKKMVEEQGKTVFFATHNLPEAEELSDRLAIIFNGKIKAWGTLEKMRKTLGVNRTYLLKLETPTRQTLTGLDQIITFDKSKYSISNVLFEKGSFEIELKDEKITIADINEKLVTAGGRLLSCVLKGKSLQDVYQKIVN